MNNLQENRLSMYLTMKELFLNHEGNIENLPNFAANREELMQMIEAILIMTGVQITSKTGITDNKNQLREKLITMIGDYARKLAAYAKLNNNLELFHEINFSESKVRNAPDTVVMDYALLVQNKAADHMADLTVYQITEESQTALSEAMGNYFNYIGKPGVSRNEMTQNNTQLRQYFKQADAALDRMDAAVEVIRLSDESFYNTYRSSRKIIYNGRGSLTVQGFVTEATSGEPIKGATLVFTPVEEGAVMRMADASDGIITKKSAERGGFKIKHMAEGIYKVTIKKVGYEEQSIEVAVDGSELTNLTVQLQHR